MQRGPRHVFYIQLLTTMGISALIYVANHAADLGMPAWVGAIAGGATAAISGAIDRKA